MKTRSSLKESRKRACEGEEEQCCGYCMQQMKNGANARKLACGHAICFTCMAEEPSTSGQSSLQCPTCGKAQACDEDSLSSSSSLSDGTATPDMLSPCDRCHNEPAVKYCKDCGEKICARHLKFHDGYFEDIHETVEITEYTENPFPFNKAFICEHHENERITMACTNCYQFNCKQCSNELSTCDDLPNPADCLKEVQKYSYRTGFFSAQQYFSKSGRGHIFRFLSEIHDKIIKEFQGKLSVASSLVEKCSELDKKSWAELDTLSVRCKEMIADVEKKAKEQCELIEKQKKELVDEIQNYESEMTTKIVSFAEDIAKKKENIEEVRRSTHMFIRDSPVADLMKYREEKMKALDEVNGLLLGSSPLPIVKELRIGKKWRMEVEFNSPRTFPSTLDASAFKTFRMSYAGNLPVYQGQTWENQSSALL